MMLALSHQLRGFSAPELLAGFFAVAFCASLALLTAILIGVSIARQSRRRSRGALRHRYGGLATY